MICNFESAVANNEIVKLGNFNYNYVGLLDELISLNKF